MGIETRIGVDVGGAFTDVAFLTPGGRLVTAKVPNADGQSVGVIRDIERAHGGAGIDPAEVDAFTHAMTTSVSALLEDNGAMIALVTAEGLRDMLETGRQARPDLYDATVDKLAPPVPHRHQFEVTERATIEGIQTEINESEIQALTDNIHDAGAESVAVSLPHVYRHSKNERVVANVLREESDIPVSASREMLAEFCEFERTSITAVDAYMTPAVDSYLGCLESRAVDLGVPILQIMQTNGDIAPASTVRGYAVVTMMSGSAAGAVGVAETATDPGGDLADLVTFDMGGTPSDVGFVHDGEVEWTTDAETNGRPIKASVVGMNTVGAGGRSIAWTDSGNALRVRLRSSGMNPDPVCYGRGGTEPTATDASIVLGYIGGSSAPGGELSLDMNVARDALSGLATDAKLGDALAVTRGVYRVADANITRAIRAATVERGRDPRQFGLAAFGGAGPVHAAALTEGLDIETVAIPRACGVFSAYGLLAADRKHGSVRTLHRPLSGLSAEAVESVYADLEADTLDDVTDPGGVAVRRAVDLQYVDQGFELAIPVGETFDAEAVEVRFHEAHESIYGYRLDDSVKLVNVRVIIAAGRDSFGVTYRDDGGACKDTREAFFDGELRETPVYDRDGLDARTTAGGPAILEQHESAVVVPPVWSGTVGTDRMLVLTSGGDGE